jgi:hypothetical protein
VSVRVRACVCVCVLTPQLDISCSGLTVVVIMEVYCSY